MSSCWDMVFLRLACDRAKGITTGFSWVLMQNFSFPVSRSLRREGRKGRGEGEYTHAGRVRGAAVDMPGVPAITFSQTRADGKRSFCDLNCRQGIDFRIPSLITKYGI